MENEKKISKLMMALAMTIFGTIGLFRRYIPMSSSVIAFSRGIIGTMFLILVVCITKKRISRGSIKKNFKLLLISGALIGFNWIALFESYNHTTVATATLCYYMAPIIVILMSPLLLKERLGIKKCICVVVALIGMVLVSGILKEGNGLKGDGFIGVILGLLAAAMYATVILTNKFIKDISAYDKTIMQLGFATVALVPYILLTEDVTKITFSPLMIAMLVVVGIIHTGVAYVLYFGSMDGMKAQTIALMGYIDPVVAIILSALVLHEAMGIFEVIGAIFILGSTFFSEKA